MKGEEPYDPGHRSGILSLVHRLRVLVKPNLLAISAAMVLSCAAGGAGADEAEQDRHGRQPMSSMTIEEALKTHTPELMSLPGVIGTGQGLCEGQPCVKVLVVEKTPELERAIHAILKGVPVTVQETGRIRARPGMQD